MKIDDLQIYNLIDFRTFGILDKDVKAFLGLTDEIIKRWINSNASRVDYCYYLHAGALTRYMSEGKISTDYASCVALCGGVLMTIKAITELVNVMITTHFLEDNKLDALSDDRKKELKSALTDLRKKISQHKKEYIIINNVDVYHKQRENIKTDDNKLEKEHNKCYATLALEKYHIIQSANIWKTILMAIIIILLIIICYLCDKATVLCLIGIGATVFVAIWQVIVKYGFHDESWMKSKADDDLIEMLKKSKEKYDNNLL